MISSTPKKSPIYQVRQFSSTMSGPIAPAAKSIPVPIVGAMRQGRTITSKTAMPIRRMRESSILSEKRWARRRPTSAWMLAATATTAAMAMIGTALSKLARSNPFMTLSAKDPSQMPGQITGPRSSRAHSATPDAGQMIVA